MRTVNPSTYFAFWNGLEVLIVLYLFLYSSIWGNKRHCNPEVVQSSAALNSVGKENNLILVIQFSQHEPSIYFHLYFEVLYLIFSQW
jgi:hypothetical protein